MLAKKRPVEEVKFKWARRKKNQATLSSGKRAFCSEGPAHKRP